MNIEQLTYIVEVAKVKSLAKAARTLNITQSGLSQAITKLEAELNIKIFERNNSGAVSTKEGDKIIEKARIALHAVYQINEEAHKQLITSDYLKILTIPGILGPVIDNYLPFKKAHPHFKIEVIEKSSFEIIEDIKRGIMNTGFIAINHANLELITELEFTPILEGEIMLYASEDFHSPVTDQQLTLDMLKNQIFVLYKDDYVEECVMTLQRVLGPLDILFKTTNLELISKAVTELGALTIGHDISSVFDQPKKMRALNIEHFMDTSFKFGWIKRSDYKLSMTSKAFINEINQTLLKVIR